MPPPSALALDLRFEGFGPEAFEILARLEREPHVGRYREEKEGVRRFIQEPFRRFRDDLAVNWVIPEGLMLETERNVFSRLLKNDFGAGGCHHHLWMAFYHPARTRLTDVQILHSLWPDGFHTGLYAGDQAGPRFRDARRRAVEEADRFLALVAPLGRLGFEAEIGEARFDPADPEAWRERLPRARGFWVGRSLPREAVIERRQTLVAWAREGAAALWPVYRFLTG